MHPLRRLWLIFAVALQFLSIFPIRFKTNPPSQLLGQSLLAYPLVGALFGLLLMGLGELLAYTHLNTGVQAALILSVWVALSGALHLDGLADSADAWLGGLGNRERTLAIMKDPCCGPMAVVVMVLLLLIKFTAIEALLNGHHWGFIVLAPLLARSLLILLFLTTPYVRANGLGSPLVQHLPRRTAMGMLALTTAIIVYFSGDIGLILILPVTLLFFALRHMMTQRLGGTTGDTAGAMLEITEAFILLVLVFL